MRLTVINRIAGERCRTAAGLGSCPRGQLQVMSKPRHRAHAVGELCRLDDRARRHVPTRRSTSGATASVKRVGTDQ